MLTRTGTDLCRKLLLGSLMGVMLALGLLGCAFRLSESSAPGLLPTGSTCPAPHLAGCTQCLKHGCAGPVLCEVPVCLSI